MMLAGVVEMGKLVQQRDWNGQVASLKREASRLGFFGSSAAARRAIGEALIAAVENRAGTAGKFGVLLSGGIDSSFIAFILKKLGLRFTCFCVGVSGSKDLAAARVAARKLRLELVSKEYPVAAAEAVIRVAVKILGTADPVAIGIAATEIAALRLVTMNKVGVVFTGLGSEEIFAGYQRHVIADDVNGECWRGLAAMWARDFLRDFRVAAAFRVKALTPFLDKKVIVAAMRARPGWKIRDGEKKLILREIAAAAGLPEEIAFRPKLAAQYGSGFDRMLGKLARASGFAGKREYLRFVLASGKSSVAVSHQKHKNL